LGSGLWPVFLWPFAHGALYSRTMRLLALLLVLVAAPALADRAGDIAKAEAWVNAITTARARFTQTDNAGNQATGTFSLSRPGRMRFEYDQSDDFIVADGVLVYFYDSVVGQQSNAPIGATLADFLLRKRFSLTGDGDLRVTDIRRAGGYLQISVVQAEDLTAGSLALAFTEEPFALAKWRVVDAQGAVTEVELFHLERGVDFPGGTFAYRDPPGATRYEYNE